MQHFPYIHVSTALANKHHRLRDSVPITIWPSGGLRLVTDIKKNNKSRVKQEPRSAHGRAVKKQEVAIAT